MSKFAWTLTQEMVEAVYDQLRSLTETAGTPNAKLASLCTELKARGPFAAVSSDATYTLISQALQKLKRESPPRAKLVGGAGAGWRAR